MADCWKDGQLFDSRNQNISVRKLSTRNHFNPNTGGKRNVVATASERAREGGRERVRKLRKPPISTLVKSRIVMTFPIFQYLKLKSKSNGRRRV